MIEKITVSMIAGRIAGILTLHARRNWPAPSISAASYSSPGIDTEGRVHDDHVVADELPRDDVHHREEDVSGRQEVRCAEADRPGDLGDRAEVRAVEVAPHQRRDDRGHGVRHEDQQSDALGSSGPHRVEREGEEEREASMIGTWTTKNSPTRPRPPRNSRIGQRPGVVVEAREDLPADELALEEAQIAGVDERDDEHRDEHDEERKQEEVRRQVLFPLCRTGAPRRLRTSWSCARR